MTQEQIDQIRADFERRLSDSIGYDPESGRLFWKVSPHGRIAAGSDAGGLRNCGYVKLTFRGRIMMAHRVAWFLYYGAWPKNQIDRINRNPADNRIENLRDVVQNINMRNTNLMRKNCNSGYPGVRYRPDRKNCWRTEIKIDNKTIALGCYSDPETAHAAYMTAKRKLHNYQV